VTADRTGSSERQRVLIKALQTRIVHALQDEARVERVWLGGSLGRGEGDALSDIDLVIVSSSVRTDELKRSLDELIRIVGPVALVHTAPHNAPTEGAQLNVLYDTDPLPVYIDWNLWPPVEQRPADVSVLFEREPTLPAATACFHEMLADMPHGTVDRTEQTLNHFRVFMTPILAKHAARGWFDSVARMLQVMDVESEQPVTNLQDAIELAHRVLEEFGASETPTAMACVRRYLALIDDFGNQR